MKFAWSLLLVCTLAASACSKEDGNNLPTTPTTTTTTTANPGFSTTDLRVGTGAEATTGRTVTVNYSGWLYSAGATDNKGTLFDSSLAAGRAPLTFVVGTSQLIPGFSQGTVGMRVGGLRRVVLPPNLAYGSQGNGPIPPNATIIFELELLAVQ